MGIPCESSVRSNLSGKRSTVRTAGASVPTHAHGKEDQLLMVGDRQLEARSIPEMLSGITLASRLSWPAGRSEW